MLIISIHAIDIKYEKIFIHRSDAEPPHAVGGVAVSVVPCCTAAFSLGLTLSGGNFNLF